MGSLIRTWKTIPMPAGATVRKNAVKWTTKKKIRTGKLSGMNRVSVQVDTWTAQFTDESGKVCRVSTKTSNRSAAEKILARHEAEVERVKAGIVTRNELAKVYIKHISLKKAIEQFQTKLVASGNTVQYIETTLQQTKSVLKACGIDTIAKLHREAIERWLADEIQKKTHTARTINAYLNSVKAFVQYLVDIEILPGNPLKSIHNLNQELDRRKVRRAMTAAEVKKLLRTVSLGKSRTKEEAKEQILIYRLLLGTGLRSTELSLLTPSQIDFKCRRLTIEATKTKNKKADILPLHPDLAQSVKDWIKAHGIQPHERIFRYNQHSLRRLFYQDLKAAGIERKGKDGRSVDVHSLRKTFGTMLAAAGVPLTTVQRLMRHSTPTLTAKLYIDVDPICMAQALKKLPAF